MMNLAAVGAMVAVVGLFFQALQTMSLSKAAKAQVYQALVASWVDLDKLLLADPRLRKYVYEGADLPDGDENLRESILTVVDIAMNVADLTFQLENQLPRDVRKAWHEAARLVLSSPAATQYRASHPDFFPHADSVVDGTKRGGVK